MRALISFAKDKMPQTEGTKNLRALAIWHEPLRWTKMIDVFYIV